MGDNSHTASIYRVWYRRPGDEWKLVGGHFSTKKDALECANEYGSSGRYETKIGKDKITYHHRWNRES